MRKLKTFISILLCTALMLCCTSVAASASGEKYLVIGDSIGYGAGIKNPDEANYGRIIADTNGFDYKNNAVSGYTSDDLRNRLLKDERFRDDVAWADIISVSIGGNDFLRSNYVKLVAEGSFDDYSDFDRIVSHYAENIVVIIGEIKSLNPDALILFQTLYNPATGEKLKAVYAEALARLNGAVYTYLDDDPGAYVIVDVAAVMNSPESQIAYDTIHPNAEGNIVIAQAVQDKLVELGIAGSNELVLNKKGEDWTATATKSFFGRIREFFARLIEYIKNIFSF